jgi:hypothetical protein
VAHRFSFPQVQEIQIKQLVHNLLTSEKAASEDNIKRLQEKLSSLSGVRLERSADTLGILWEKLSKSESFTVEKELNTGPSVSLYSLTRFDIFKSLRQRRTLPKVSDCVKVALLHSIHTGIFVDYRFFAKNRKGRGDSIRPIYLSSAVAGERLRLMVDGMCHHLCFDRVYL